MQSSNPWPEVRVSLSNPWLMVVSLAVAAVGVLLLLRPPRRRVQVANVDLWRRAAEQVGPRRSLRMPPAWVLLPAVGAVLAALAAGGPSWTARSPQPQGVLVVLADTPHLLVRDAEGRTGRDLLADRLAQLLDAMETDTPVRLVVLGTPIARRHAETLTAGQWLGRVDSLTRSLDSFYDAPPGADVQSLREGVEGAVYLLGEFHDLPAAADQHWIFRPLPPARDIGIIAAGASRVAGRVQLFVAVRRSAGDAATAKVTVARAGEEEPLFAAIDIPVDSAGRGQGVIDLNADVSGPLELRLAATDDQPLNDIFRLAAAAGDSRVTVQVVGRPSRWLDRAIAASDRLSPAGPGQVSDWLIVNEPADALIAEAGQGTVIIDPLTAPAGVSLGGQLADVEIAARSDEPPWREIDLAGVTVGRSIQAKLDPRWSAVARDKDGNPLIAWRSATRQLLVLFSVSPDNTNWPRLASWPLFWDALADLGGGESAVGQWTWQAGRPPGLREGIAVNLPPEAFAAPESPDPQAINTASITTPPPASAPADVPLWPLLAGAAAVCLAGGWALAALRRGLTLPDGAG